MIYTIKKSFGPSAFITEYTDSLNRAILIAKANSKDSEINIIDDAGEIIVKFSNRVKIDKNTKYYDLPEDFELGHLEAALNYIKNFRTAVDGGAHKGIWSKYMQGRFDKVISYELTEYNVNRFIADKTNLRQKALGDVSKRVSFEKGPENTGQFHVVDGDDVEMVRLDDEGIENLDFLKLDVEGCELFALKGAKEIILRDLPCIILEANHLSYRYGIEPDAPKKWLESLGYKEVEKLNKDHVFVHRDRL